MHNAVYTFEKQRKKKKKGTRAFKCSRTYSCNIDISDMATGVEIKEELLRTRELLCEVQEENAILHQDKTKVEALYLQLKEAMTAEATVTTTDEDDDLLLQQLAREHKELRQHIALEETKHKHSGKQHHLVGTRQQERNVKRIKNSAEAALWFLKSYGMELESINLKDAASKKHTIQIGAAEKTLSTSYNKMSEHDQEVVERTLFALEKFCGSDALYNDLVQVTSATGLPKLYQVVQCRNELNKPMLQEITPTPGNSPGSQRSLTKCLQQEAHDGSTLRVRVSVDGAKISKKSNFIVMSYAVLDNNALAASGNKIVGIVSAPETYETLATSFAGLLDEASKIATDGHIEVDGKKNRH